MAVEYEATPLLLLAIFDEDCELFCKVVEECASDEDLGDMSCSPFIIAKGGSFITARNFTICIDTLPVIHATNPCQAFRLMFFAHFAFNLAYPKDTSLCLEFIQRFSEDERIKERQAAIIAFKSKLHYLFQLVQIICQMEVGDPAPDDQLEPPPDMDDMFDVPPSPCEEYAPSTNGAQQRGGVTKCARPTCRIEEKNPVRPCDTAEADN
ncbi:hypothetical protein HPB49_003994 [Dermacentor silvarum]|uniref:Uncharacterized protein n=1 Tax=Dermacentor silvarum TaxID=543639 RepID=A0ACB8CV76_DERSI|nr:hypothetical protein HPB49_003994 [Dermacentor silvarum]